jgi:hypothetical protein
MAKPTTSRRGSANQDATSNLKQAQQEDNQEVSNNQVQQETDHEVVSDNPGPTPTEKSTLLNPFAPENLRLDQNYADTVGVRKVLISIPVRKPGRQEWIRVHPAAEYVDNFNIIELREENETYIVSSKLVGELSREIVQMTLYLAITRQGNVFFWPVRLPTPDGRDMDWWRNARTAAEQAKPVGCGLCPIGKSAAITCSNPRV